MDTLLQDIRYALRVCVRTPGLTAIAILALALGIGANTAIFTIVNAVLLQRLPFRDSERIVALWEESTRRPGRHNVVGPSQFLRWSDRATVFERMALLVDVRQNLTGSGTPEEVVLQIVTPDFFPILGVSPLLGRTFTDAETRDPQANVVMLGYDFWRRRFGGDPDIVGRAIQLNGRPTLVAGVMPSGFRLFIKERSAVGKPADLWAPWVLPANARDFVQLQREAQTNATLYTALLTSAQELRLARAGMIASARVVDPPAATERPVKPMPAIVFSIAAALGLMLGVALAFVRRQSPRIVRGEARWDQRSRSDRKRLRR